MATALDTTVAKYYFYKYGALQMQMPQINRVVFGKKKVSIVVEKDSDEMRKKIKTDSCRKMESGESVYTFKIEPMGLLPVKSAVYYS